MKHPRIPHGCDQQGRYPEAAEPCTELGQNDPEFYGRDFWRSEAIDLLIFAIGLVAFVAALAMVFGPSSSTP
jgi:hypothetical protein